MVRRALLLVLALLLVPFGEVLGAGAAQAADPAEPPSNGGRDIMFVASTTCITVDYTLITSSPATAVRLGSCKKGKPNSAWLYKNGTLQVYANGCLTVLGRSKGGTNVGYGTCNGGEDQQWRPNINGTITTVDGLCLATVGGSKESDALLQVRACDGSDLQTWMGPEVSMGGQPVRNTASGLCLTMEYRPPITSIWDLFMPFDYPVLATCDGSIGQAINAADGKLRVFANTCYVGAYDHTTSTGIVAFACSHTQMSALPWSFNENGTISNKAGHCLEPYEGVLKPGTMIAARTCDGSMIQQWIGPAFANRGLPVTNPTSGRCLDVPGGSTIPGTFVQIWDCNGGAGQIWNYVGGALKAYANMCLDVAGGVVVSGVRVAINGCSGVASQQWLLYGDGTITTANGLCLEADGSGTGNGVGLRVTGCTGSASQQWRGPGDRLNPDTAITDGPQGGVVAGSVTFAFTSNEPGSTFQCQWGAGAWAACTSPTTATVAPGSVTFSVRAIDSAGNVDATPASRTLLVTGPPAAPVAPGVAVPPANPVVAPPAAGGPTSGAGGGSVLPSLKVKVKAVRRAGWLAVDVDPDWAQGDYAVVVQKLKGKKWVTVTKLKTKGPKDKLTRNLPRGRYRVLVSRPGYAAYTSASIRLAR